MWSIITRIEGTKIYGKLDNDPAFLEMELGDATEFEETEIEDMIPLESIHSQG